MTDDIDKDAAEYAIHNLGKLLILLSENEEKILKRAEVYYDAEIERLRADRDKWAELAKKYAASHRKLHGLEKAWDNE